MFIDFQQFSTLLEINNRISSDYEDIDALLRHILESAVMLTKGETASLLFFDQNSGQLWFEQVLDKKSEFLVGKKLNPGEGIAGWVAEHNQPAVVNEVSEDPRYSPRISDDSGFVTRSILAVPMSIKNICVGVIQVLNKKNGNFSETDLLWLKSFASQAAIAIQNARKYKILNDRLVLYREESHTGYHNLVYESPQSEALIKMVKRVALSDSAVLICGESGVGKELAAEQIHLKSHRQERAFIRINCAAIPEELFENELFGYKKGAFTDAYEDKAGKFQLGDGGTLFLDEIGEIPLKVQAKLLRVLQDGTYQRVGDSVTSRSDVRIVAATNRNLQEMVQKGEFRQDLYYRINVLPLTVPPLRERPADIPVLSRYFLKELSQKNLKHFKGFSKEAMAALVAYQWPGNIRELRNVIERAVIVNKEDEIISDSLLLSSHNEVTMSNNRLKDAMTVFKKNFIKKTLDSNNMNITKSAQVLGVQRSYLSRLIKELNIID